MAEYKKNTGLVYSTAWGKMCPECNQKVADCRCRKKTVSPPSDGIVRLRRETKGRKGKGMTVITGLPLDRDALSELARSLKQACGGGGTIRDGIIEIQGDHLGLIRELLRSKGFTVKG